MFYPGFVVYSFCLFNFSIDLLYFYVYMYASFVCIVVSLLLGDVVFLGHIHLHECSCFIEFIKLIAKKR